MHIDWRYRSNGSEGSLGTTPHIVVWSDVIIMCVRVCKREREREERERRERGERLIDRLNFYYTRIEVKAQMPVEQPVLDTNYKHLKIIRTWPKTTMIKTIITIAIIVAYRGENNIKCLREKANEQKTK